MASNTYLYGAVRDSRGTAEIAKSRVRAIVVDDSPEMIATATELLEFKGEVEVVATASNGVDAVRVAQMFDPDLVLMDINMPRMNGLTAALQIREISDRIKILMMSSEDGPDAISAALDCGADGFIAKERLVKEIPQYVYRLFPAKPKAMAATHSH